MNLVFCDIDNTLSDARQRLLEGGERPVFDEKNQAPFLEWLARIHEPSKLAKDQLVKPVGDMVKALSRTHQVYYLTAREEAVRDITENWLANKGLPSRRVLMRAPGNNAPMGKYKENWIKAMLGANLDATEVIVIDDDPDNELQEICAKNKWLFIKVVL